MANLTSKEKEVVVRVKGVQYSYTTIYMKFHINEVEDTYQKLLDDVDDNDLTIIMGLLCIEGTPWIENNLSNEWVALRMALKNIPNLWYQFLKHLI